MSNNLDEALLPVKQEAEVDGAANDLRDLSDLLGGDFILGASNQATLERHVMEGADEDLRKQDVESEKKRLTKTRKTLAGAREKWNELDARAGTSRTQSSIQSRMGKLEGQIENLVEQEKEILGRLRDLQEGPRQRQEQREVDAPQQNTTVVGRETEREMLTRTGRITPFERTTSAASLLGTGASVSVDVTEDDPMLVDDVPLSPPTASQPRGKKRLRKVARTSSGDDTDDDYTEAVAKKPKTQISESEEGEFGGSDDGSSDGEIVGNGKRSVKYQDRHADDGNEAVYQKRLLRWARKRRRARRQEEGSDRSDDARSGEETDPSLGEDPDNEPYEPAPFDDDEEYEGGYRMPGDIYNALFGYQRTCTRWLWELHSQETGGIIGDEMGLGKTIQIISYLAGLHHSKKLDGPVIIVCPATVLRQWVQEFHKWWPPMRVIILHSTGSGLGASDVPSGKDKGLEEELYANEDAVSDEDTVPEYEDRRGDRDQDGEGRRRRGKKVTKDKNPAKLSAHALKMLEKAGSLVDRVLKSGHVILTTFAGVRVYAKKLLPVKWSYCILDEGHKIRNPDAVITLACKQIRTPHRIVLTGTPIQNNLTELWSLYDFVFPGRLGTLPVFQTQFAIPINLGSYANANNVQVQTAHKCAVVLRDLISPYLLRRMKVDVATDLPKKSEQVLFCRLTDFQRQQYKTFLGSNEVASILAGKRHALFGIDIMRKICNHPDLLDKEAVDNEDYGAVERSGKMKVVQALLRMWKKQGHRTLLFCQTRQMQNILQKLIIEEKYSFRRMDGTTPIKNRIAMVDEFNETASIDLFLLTTRVGGLGINLTGANRIVIFDPDWNPSTDVQARERAWRIGQKKEVTIYRLMTSGTIEEKIYHRQILKQFLTNKILKDPRQRRFFKSNDLNDLFILGGADDTGTETGDLFHGMSAEVNFSAVPSASSRTQIPGKELAEISGVDKVGSYETTTTEGDGDAATQPAEDDESRVLKLLFSKTGVHSALHHDVIVDAASPEALIVEKEAKRVADEALRALKQSRKRAEQMRKADGGGVHMPTYTGRSGAAGAPRRFGPKTPTVVGAGIGTGGFGTGSTPGFGSSSSAASGLSGSDAPYTTSATILANLRQRSALERPDDAGPLPPDGALLDPASRSGLILRIRDYLSSKGGKASTKDMLNEFRESVPSEDVPVFKKMLKGVAEYSKNAVRPKKGEQSGPGAVLGYWTLRPEFR
ncbi:hypothetical protein HKX48_000055 [Thoreauomyces humboldtii]|nr:hypothetical protein HKX48_000055 [Thoreauomyces humboldtii]